MQTSGASMLTGHRHLAGHLYAAPAPCRPARALRAGSIRAGKLTPEQTKQALEYQLSRSKPKATKPAARAPASPATTSEAVDADIKRRKQEARKWITPWLTAARQERSEEVLEDLRRRSGLMGTDQQAAALKRQLEARASQQAKGNGAAPAGSSNGATASAGGKPAQAGGKPAKAGGKPASAPSNGSGKKFSPTETYEDGSLMFTADLLQAVSYEDVLAP